MLFTKQVFHLECLSFRIKSQPGVAHKSAVYKRAFNVVFKSSKNEKNNFAMQVYFCVYLVSHWGNLVRRVLSKARGLEKI